MHRPPKITVINFKTSPRLKKLHLEGSNIYIRSVDIDVQYLVPFLEAEKIWVVIQHAQFNIVGKRKA
jgi:hypothetical protein